MSASRFGVRSFITGVVALALGAATARAELIHRYSFTDAVKDSVGNVDGVLKGDAKVEGGKLVLDNTGKTSENPKLAYAEFPKPIAPKEGSVSFVAFVNIPQNPHFARILDIGDVEAGEGRAFMYLLTKHEEGDVSRAAITATDVSGRTFVPGPALDDGKPHVAVMIVDGAAKKLRYYVDGKETQAAEDVGDNTLDKVRQMHAWIGRSAFDIDPGLTGAIDELRVYDHVLSEAEIKAIQEAGPDKLPPASAAAPTTAPAAKP